MDDLERQAYSGIQSLELELIVRDFVAVLNDGPTTDLCAFLTEDVIYRASPRQTVTGRKALLEMIDDIRSTFDEWQTSLIDIAVTRDVVLSQQAIRLRLPGSTPQRAMGFASFRIDGFRISAWHQLHA